MKGWIKYLLQDSLIYGIGYGLSRFLHIIILPIIAGALTLSEFGYYSNLVIFYTILGGFFVFGLDSAVARFFYDSEERRYHQKLLSTSLLFIFLISLICVLGLLQFRDLLLQIIGVPKTYNQALPSVLYCVPILALNNFFLSWFKWKRQKKFFLINSSATIVFLLIPLLLVKTISFTFIFQVVLWSQLLVVIISTLLASTYIRYYFDTVLLTSLLRYGLPWMLVFLLGISRTYLDRIFLTHSLNEDLYGLYNFSIRIATLLSILITAFDMSFGPLAFSIWNKSEAPPFFSRLQSVYILIISSVASLISIVSPFLILKLGGEKYNGSEKILPFLLFAAIPLSLINFSNLGTTYAKKSYLSAGALFGGFATVLLLNFLLTPYYLQYGAAIASLTGHIVIIIVGYFLSNRYYPIGFSYLKDTMIYFSFFFLSLIFTNLSFISNIYGRIILQTTILIVLITIILLFFFREDLRRVLSYLKNFSTNK